MCVAMWRRPPPHASKPSIAFGGAPDDKPADRESALVKPLSIEDSLQWTQRFVAREWKLLLPVAFAFLALPQLALDLLLPARIEAQFATITPATVGPLLTSAPWLAPVAALVQLIAFFGGLAIVALALVPRVSVGEALLLALRRFLIFVAALILVVLAVSLAASFVEIIFRLARLSLPSVRGVLVGILFGIGLVASVRLIALAPVVVASRAGPIAAIQLAWELTAGAFWRLAGAMLVYAIGGTVVVFASAFAFGAIFVLSGRALGVPDLGAALSTIDLRLARAVFWTGFHVLVVALYRQLGGAIRGT
jgi:hypothetical protein